MKLEAKDLPKKLLPIVRKLREYIVFIFIILLLAAFGFLVYQIRNLTSQEPTDDAISEKLETVQRPRIDQDSLDKIQALQQQNVQVQALFSKARENPFNE